ncbi:uncharacterized protein LOC125674963 isoform X3 [Ostrea edulis]|uniref:uncharacterized protein LOC125674963 isoform X3 n=1 Tax=Ostrea edulis TaxID=37623 RepID=UPI0024AEB6FD|nr:uncharacterized protein LOC125674963 isoform X3 [Ostrea edulis]
MDGDVLNLSGMGIHQISLPSGADPTTVILDKNSISKIDNLDKCQNLKQLSLAGNRMVRMTSITRLRNLTVLNLPNNSIVAIEGLKELVDLEWLNLSANRIEVIEGLTNNHKLRHLDLSDNSITQITGLSHLICLRTLLLHGNIISTLESAPQSLPRSLAILSLAENEITDLNEVRFLSCFELEQVSLMNNPCVLMTSSTPGFDARPFIINWIQTLLVLDGYMVTEKERLKAEWLYSQGKGRHFRSGQQSEIVEYLSSNCPLTSSAQTRPGRVKKLIAKLESQEDAKLSQILSKQRQHKEQLHQGRQLSSPEPPHHLTSSHHSTPPEQQTHSSVSFSTQEQNTGVSTLDFPVDLVGRAAGSRYGIDRVPLQAWSSSNDRSTSLGLQKGTYSTDHQGSWHLQNVGVDADNDAKSHSSLLESESTYIPLEIASTPNRPMTAPAVTSSAPLNNYPFYMQTDNRPATSAETRYDAYDRRPIKPLNTDVFKGIRHNFQVSPPTQSGNEPALGTKKKTPPTAQAHDYDTSQEASQSEQILNPTKENIPVEEISNIKDISKDRRSSARRSTSQRSDGKSLQRKKDSERSDRSSIPVSNKTSGNISRTHSDYTPGRYAPRKHSEQSGNSSNKSRRRDSKSKGNRDSGVFSRPSSDAILDTDHRAATLIQATWRGYWAREHNPEVVSVRKEMRARRAEDHIVVLRAELDRQRKLYDEERHMRALQMEAIRCLWKEVQSLQNWKSEVLNTHQFKNTVDSSHQDDSYNYSQEIQNTLERVGVRHGDSGKIGYSVEDERQRELERTCASLQNQVAQLSQALQSVSSVVFQSGIMTAGMDSINNDVEQTLLVTGYEEEESSSCEEMSFTGSKWATVPHSLSPYPSEEEEQYFYSFPQLGCPTPPRNLHMEHKGENSIVISWGSSKILDSSFKEVNKPLLGYRVYVDDKPAAMINGLSALVHGLNPQVTYKIYVKAVSSLGESNSSDILMAAMSQAARVRTSSTDSNRTDSDHDSTESSDLARRRKENHQRQKRRIKSPRQDKRQSSRKGSSASDQDRPPSRSEKSKSNIGANGVFKQPKIHMRPSSRDSSRVPELHAEPQYSDSVQGLPQPSESKRSPQAGSQNKGPSTSQMSETFTVESSESLLMAISRAQSSLGMNESSDQSVKTHRRKRSKDLKTYELQDDDVNQNQGSPSAGSVHFQNVMDQCSKVGGDKDNMNKSVDIPREKTQTHRRTRSKDYEWRKEIDLSGHTRDPERKEVKKAWVKDSPTGEVHGIPIIDASKRHSSGSRPSSPAPSDTSEKSDKKRTVAELLEKFSSKGSTNFGTNSLGTEGSDQHASLPPRSRRTNSNEDVSAMPESRRTPTKNMSPSYTERRRTPSNGSESDASELSSSSAARQLDMDRKPGPGSTGINKLLQKLQNFSKSQEESLQNRAQKMKKKSTSESPGIEEEHRRPRRISGGSEGDSVSERTIHQSDSSSQSDDPQLNRKPYKTHKRSGSDQKVTVSHHHQSSAPPTPSHRSTHSTSSRFEDYTPRPGSNVKRTASFHGVTPSPHKVVQPRRSGSDENLYDKAQEQTPPDHSTTHFHISSIHFQLFTDQGIDKNSHMW